MAKARGAPCDECGGTTKRHNGGCSQGGRGMRGGYGGKNLQGKPKTCGETTRKAGRMTNHVDHKCPLPLLTGGKPHPGSHICHIPNCEVTWY